MTIGIGTNYAQTYDPYWEQYLQASQYLNASRQAQATTLPQSQAQTQTATIPQAQTPVDIMQQV